MSNYSQFYKISKYYDILSKINHYLLFNKYDSKISKLNFLNDNFNKENNISIIDFNDVINKEEILFDIKNINDIEYLSKDILIYLKEEMVHILIYNKEDLER